MLFAIGAIPALGWLYHKKNMTNLKLEYNITIARTLGKAASLRDQETETHNLRVSYVSSLLGSKQNFSKSKLQALMKGAFLHDIGKIGIPDSILLKNGKLDESEWKIMKLHPTLGNEFIDSLPWFNDAKDVILYHHEKFDGSGYPKGLKGDDIPINARIFAVIDVFDALVTKRPYKDSMSMTDALKIIKDERNTHFDPDIVDLFCENIENIYKDVYQSSEENLQLLLIEQRKNIFGL